ncbi:MAG TPA: LLM class F420-dependent oxidoreductase [Methylomirabilota bacterium]|nr:LLM class F420-dependent oxidoreductase [Methylomirabilota bacterium]
MKYGIAMFPTDYAIPIDELARELEARAFESVWLPEHTHIPASRKSPWPGGPNLPREYWHTLDPFVALGAAAVVTKTLKLGTGICLVIERDPILLAKEVASLDHLSQGRVLFGIGGGWNAEEMEHHGTPFAERWKILRERIGALKAIWTQDEAEFHGKYVNFEKLWSYPKPVQKPYPPILMGGAGPHARQRAVDFDGHWIPIGGRAYSEPIAESLADFRARAEKAGRDPATLTVTIFGVAPDEPRLAALRDAGITRAVFFVPSATRDVVLPLLDQYAGLAKKVG